MSFEKIAPPNTRTEAGEKLEHPAYKAARVIRQLHTDNIELINSGYVFMKDGVDVSDSMKASCEQQIKLCNEIMQRAENMDPSHWSPSLLLCEEVQSLVGKYHADRNKGGDQ